MCKFKNVFYLISIFFFFTNLHSQEINYRNNDIKYTYAQQDLKEFLIIQTLLSENRINELVEFLDENFYTSMGEGEYTARYIKNRNVMNEIFPVIQIDSGKSSEEYFDNSLLIYFGFLNNKETTEWAHTKLEAQIILQLFRDSIEIGLSYPYFKNVDTNETLVVENINRYTKKLISKVDSSKTKIIKASNFMKSLIYPDKILLFYGPGKTGSTEIKINPIAKSDSESLATVLIRSFKTNDLNSKQPFNLQFFSNLKNLNDRIWLDR